MTKFWCLRQPSSDLQDSQKLLVSVANKRFLKSKKKAAQRWFKQTSSKTQHGTWHKNSPRLYKKQKKHSSSPSTATPTPHPPCSARTSPWSSKRGRSPRPSPPSEAEAERSGEAERSEEPKSCFLEKKTANNYLSNIYLPCFYLFLSRKFRCFHDFGIFIFLILNK